PDPIAEQPPDDRPAGANVQWVPGYWQWDGDKKDFVWVSGFWRDMPAERRWVMGYWAQTAEGWRWVNGHWAADVERDDQFVEPPPVNPDDGPDSQPPDADSFWIPGTWFYTEAGYQYRPGYWADYRPGYVWTPARYLWTPRGYIFASGFWDYALARRGLLFAPAYFGPAGYLAANFVYRPAFTIAANVLLNSLFVRPGYGHYSFGDYYGRPYQGAGYHPWHAYSARQYDPLFAYERLA